MLPLGSEFTITCNTSLTEEHLAWKVEAMGMLSDNIKLSEGPGYGTYRCVVRLTKQSFMALWWPMVNRLMDGMV